jgi:glycosyltransferase involved in cell wall biosynthesis
MSRTRKPRISLLIPFQSTDPQHLRAWAWLLPYWKSQLPDAQIIVGRDWRSRKSWWNRHPAPFSKTTAVNAAWKRARGDIIVILDGDAFLPGEVLTSLAERLRAARAVGIRTWFVPYRHLYRLTRSATEELLASPPTDPLIFPDPPPSIDLDGSDGSGWGEAHLWGAMCLVMPREAFEAVLGMDGRMRGWGGEDVSFLWALDTLWGPHKKTPNDILHLWHHRLASGPVVEPWKVRMWDRQVRPLANTRLSVRYKHALGHPEAMAELVREAHRMSTWHGRLRTALHLLTVDWWRGQ